MFDRDRFTKEITAMRNVFSVLALIGLGVVVRLVYTEIPNFAPVSAIALFAGYLFQDRKLAVAAPLAILLITDSVLGGYSWLLMAVVYAAALLPVWWGSVARRRVSVDGSRPWQALGASLGLAGLGVGSSICFFLTTNFATWMVTPWYDRSLAGLSLCYARGLEFFRYTLAGDLGFGLLLFGGLALCQIAIHAANREVVLPARHEA